MRFEGFHGTEAKNTMAIQQEGFRATTSSGWLGSGSYFFESLSSVTSGPEEARNWVLFVKKAREWATFRATIESEKVVDLLENVDHRKLYDVVRGKALARYANSGKNLSQFRESSIYLMIAERGVEVIRALVDASREEHYTAYTVRRPQVQLCVIERSCIKAYALHGTGVG
jgi:hypothetical protein